MGYMKLLALVWNLNINSLQILVICFVLGVRFTKVSVEEKRPQQREYEDEPVIIFWLSGSLAMGILAVSGAHIIDDLSNYLHFK